MASPGGVEVGRVSIRAVPDTSHLLDELKVALDRVEAETQLNISTSIDTTRLVEQTRAAVDEAQAVAGDIDIKTNVNSSQTAEASRAFSALGSNISAVVLAAATLGPALIPLAAVLGAITVALTGPLALGVAGFSLFAFLTGAAIKQTEEQKKKIDALKASVDSARESLTNTQASAATSAANSLASAQRSAQASIKSAQVSAANATTAAGQVAAAQRVQAAHAALNARQAAISASQSASVASAQRRYNEALLEYRAALHGLTPEQEKFLEAQKGLSTAFHDLIVKVGPALLGPPTKALTLMATVLPSLAPILRSFSKVFSDFLDAISDETKTKGFENTVHLIATAGATSFREFLSIVINLATAFGNFSKAFLPFGESLMQTFVVATRSLVRFSTSANAANGIRKFLDYTHTVGPLVAAALESLARAVGHLIVAFAPIGTVALRGITSLADGISSIPTDTLTALTAAVIGLVGALKLVGPLSGIGELLVTQPEVAIVVALGAAFVALYLSSKPLRSLLADLGDFFKTQLLPTIERAASQVMPALSAAFRDISKSIKDNRPFLETMGKLLLVFASAAVVGALLGLVVAIRAIGKAVAVGIKVWHVWADVILIAVRVIVGAFQELVNVVVAAFAVIVDGAATAFGWMPKIGGKVKAAQAAFHGFADRVNGSFDTVIAKVQHMQDVIDGVGTPPPPPIKITVDDLNAVKHLEALQAFRIRDKSFRVTENVLERVVGPGGGAGHPGQTSGTEIPQLPRAGDSRSGASAGGSGGGITIQRATFTDAHDVQRQARKWLRGRAGGGVNLRISPAMGG